MKRKYLAILLWPFGHLAPKSFS